MDKKEAVNKFFEGVIKGIRQNQSANKIKASGHSADSLAYGTDKKGGQLTGSDYFYFQIHGRKPGRLPPVENIIQSIKDKGLTQSWGTVESFAWAIAFKIKKEGTDIFKGKRPGLDFDKIVDEKQKILIKDLIEGQVFEISNKLKKALTQLA